MDTKREQIESLTNQLVSTNELLSRAEDRYDALQREFYACQGRLETVQDQLQKSHNSILFQTEKFRLTLMELAQLANKNEALFERLKQLENELQNQSREND